jgi:hypothetical protein
MSVDDLVGLSPAEMDQRIPGARTAYEHRAETAAKLRQRLGIDPTSPDYQRTVAQVRKLLHQVDQL